MQQPITNAPPTLQVGGPIEPVGTPLSVKELTALLIKHYGIHVGNYDLLIEFQIGMGAFGPTPEMQAPGAMIGISKMGLVKAPQVSALTVDAALVNPPEKPRRTTKAKAS
jgi:hypothetical protein